MALQRARNMKPWLSEEYVLCPEVDVGSAPLPSPDLQSTSAMAILTSTRTQAADEHGSLTWSPITHVPDRDRTARTAFVVLSTGNGTALTLSGHHIVYVSSAASQQRVPVPARNVKVRS